MRILSLFDGMACGMLAMKRAGVEVTAYHAYEIDKYAVKTAQHNFPMIQEHGDVFAADFTVYRGLVDGVIGGSPCTFWSIAQTKNREVTPDGTGGKLFEQYFRAVEEAQPRWFIYENNKSMAKAIRAYISDRFGFEPICINSALVSAQSRQRLYWVGKRNPDGTYSKVDVQQPEDLGILLKDVLDGVGARELTDKEISYMVRETKDGRNHFDFGYHRDATQDKARCLTANVSRGIPYNVCCEPIRVSTYPGSKRPECDSKQYRIYDTEGKGVTQCGQGGGLGAKTGLYAVRVGDIGKGGQGNRIYATDGKSVAQTAESGGLGRNTGAYAIPVNTTADGKSGTIRATCYKDGIRNLVANEVDRKTGVAEPVPWYATGVEWDDRGIPTKAVSGSDGKEYTVYPVRDGQITIKGNTYPIKLLDGDYIIRKLTVSECKRLQTVPEWYEFPVSDTQAYKMLGNGWTVDVICHLIKACLKEEER